MDRVHLPTCREEKLNLRIGASDDEQVKPTAIAPDREAYVCADHVAFHYHVIGARFLKKLDLRNNLDPRRSLDQRNNPSVRNPDPNENPHLRRNLQIPTSLDRNQADYPNQLSYRVRPPRAPKGHHVEELEEMKKYLEQCEVSKREQEKILFVE